MHKLQETISFLCITILIALAEPTCAEDARPNIIFYYPDTLRAESFNAYGNKVPDVSPHFDAFAKTGTLFEQ